MALMSEQVGTRQKQNVGFIVARRVRRGAYKVLVGTAEGKRLEKPR